VIREQNNTNCDLQVTVNVSCCVYHFDMSTVRSSEYMQHAIQLLPRATPLTNPMKQVLFEKLTVTQLVKKLLAFYGTRTFITVFTTTRKSCVNIS